MPSRPRRPSINITPLIDVMFLLLIFFMVSSTFRDYLGIDVALPKAANAASQDVQVHRITVSKTGDYYVGEEKVAPEGLETALKALLEAGEDATFILEADKDARFEVVLHAIDIAKSVGGERLIIPTDPLETGSGPRQQ